MQEGSGVAQHLAALRSGWGDFQSVDEDEFFANPSQQTRRCGPRYVPR